MDYFTTTSAASRRAVDCVIVGVYENGKLGSGADDIDAASNGAITRNLKTRDIAGKLGQCTVLRDLPGVRAARVAVVGLGKISAFGAVQFRRALAAALRSVSSTKSQQVLNCLTLEGVADCDAYALARHTAETVGDAVYRFTAMKSGKQAPAMPLKKVGLAIGKRGDAARGQHAGQRVHTIVRYPDGPEARKAAQEPPDPGAQRNGYEAARDALPAVRHRRHR